MVVGCDNVYAMKNEGLSFIKLHNNELEVTFCTLGASIYSIKFLGKEMLLVPVNQDDYKLPNFYHGKTIGRLCGRIIKDNQVILHGGKEGISSRLFSYETYDNKIVFEYNSPDGESGCDGNFFLRVIYELDGSSLKMKYLATVDKDCLVSLTNHSFFCLGEDSVDKLSIKMDSDKYLDIDDQMLPKEMLPLPKHYNFKKYVSFSKTGEIDNYFQVNDGIIYLKSKDVALEIEFDFPGTVIYTDNFVDNVNTTLTDKLTHRGVALEPQDNQLFRKTLRSGENYERSMSYTFKKL